MGIKLGSIVFDCFEFDKMVSFCVVKKDENQLSDLDPSQ